jgi:ribonuclease P protein subunit RPR2
MEHKDNIMAGPESKRSVKRRAVRRRSSRPESQIRIAEERIGILFALAGKEFHRHPGRSHRYAELARKISMRYNVKIPKQLKGRLCNYCYRYLFPGKNCVVRSSSMRQAMEVKCLACGKVSRYPYSKEKNP